MTLVRQTLLPPRAVTFQKRSLRQTIDQIEAIALKQAPALQAAILGYLATTSDAVSLNAILKAIKLGDTAKVLDIIAGVDTGAAVAAVTDSLRSTLVAGGAAAAAAINVRLSGAYFAFDQLNPQLITWLRSYSLSLIQQIDAQTKDSVRQALLGGMQAGRSPIAVARDVKQAIGLTPKQAKAVQNFRASLETFHLRSSAAGWNLGAKIDRVNGRQVFRPDEDGTPLDGIDQRRLRDFRFDGTLIKAMETGKPLSPEQIDKMVSAYQRKYLRHRSETIARTEALRTTNQGVQEAWRQAIQTGKASASLVRRQWVVAKDERTCAVCSPIPGLNPKRGVAMDQPFRTPDGPVMLPPVHPNCRCTVFIRQWEPSQLAQD